MQAEGQIAGFTVFMGVSPCTHAATLFGDIADDIADDLALTVQKTSMRGCGKRLNYSRYPAPGKNNKSICF
jgi:hypothetical protein